MSNASTAKLLNNLITSQKADRARIKQLEAFLTEARQALKVSTAVRVASADAEARCDVVHEALEMANYKIAELKQELSGVRQLLAAADASNEELRGIIETLGDNLDKATQAEALLLEERAEIARQREALNHLLDTVRERMKKQELANESAILNRKALASAVPKQNFK